MLENVILGARVSMTPPEADKLAGNGPVRLVTCADGRVIGGAGSVRRTLTNGFPGEVDIF